MELGFGFSKSGSGGIGSCNGSTLGVFMLRYVTSFMNFVQNSDSARSNFCQFSSVGSILNESKNIEIWFTPFCAASASFLIEA